MCEVKLKPRDSVLNTEVSLKEWKDVLPSQIQEESSKALVFFGGESLSDMVLSRGKRIHGSQGTQGELVFYKISKK